MHISTFLLLRSFCFCRWAYETGAKLIPPQLSLQSDHSWSTRHTSARKPRKSIWPPHTSTLLPQPSLYIESMNPGPTVCAVCQLYSKPPTYKPSRYKLSKMWKCIWFQQGTKTCAISVRREWYCSLPFISYCWRSFSFTVSHLLSLLHSVTHLACSLDAIPCVPAVVLDYSTLQGTIL